MTVYRREIDGLRCLAVLPVILFHAGASQFSGGFVGVDVFFVISGYLITGIIAEEIDRGDFSVARFYERRARRILPALFLVMAVSSIMAWLWLMPDDLKKFGQSLLAVTFFGSNVLFWLQTGYFDTASELKPLLHTWSLAVEEQYYVIFPLLMLAGWRLGKKRLMLLLAVLGAISLAAAQWGALKRPAATFFLLPTRGWELLIGSLVALYSFRRGLPAVSQFAREAGAGAGLALLAISVFAFDGSTPFPSVYALVPTVGTALLILFATPQTTVGKLLSSTPLVAIGLISYSAYLWHQPLFAFARHASLDPPGPGVMAALVLLSFVLAYLSWRFVEQPFRRKNVIPLRQVVGFAVAGSAAFAIAGAAGHIRNGFSGRFDADVIAALKADSAVLKGCGANKKSGDPICTFGSASTVPSVAVLGDSHSRRLTKVMETLLAQRNLGGVLYAGSWCAPLIDFGTAAADRNPGCRAYMDAAYEKVLADPQIRTVVLAAEWANYTEGTRWGSPAIALYSDRQSRSQSLGENAAAFERALQRTAQRVRSSGKKLVLVRSVPEYNAPVPAAVARSLHFGQHELPPSLRVGRADYEMRNARVERVLSAPSLAELAQVDAFAALCPAGNCRYFDVARKKALYTDANHLSLDGAMILRDDLARALFGGPSPAMAGDLARLQ